ncbi:unnamed protein product [Trichobilharzia szidati]|nr:unnamed protein product [Trichobilharzia szidati]
MKFCIPKGLQDNEPQFDICQLYKSSVCKNGQCIPRGTSYECICNEGFEPSEDRKTCQYKIDICSIHRGYLCTNGHCIPTGRDFFCECNPGFTLSYDRRRCINKCEELGPSVCPNGYCIALSNGDYECQCDIGYQSTSDRKKCILPMDESYSNPHYAKSMNYYKNKYYESEQETFDSPIDKSMEYSENHDGRNDNWWQNDHLQGKSLNLKQKSYAQYQLLHRSENLLTSFIREKYSSQRSIQSFQSLSSTFTSSSLSSSTTTTNTTATATTTSTTTTPTSATRTANTLTHSSSMNSSSSSSSLPIALQILHNDDNDDDYDYIYDNCVDTEYPMLNHQQISKQANLNNGKCNVNLSTFIPSTTATATSTTTTTTSTATPSSFSHLFHHLTDPLPPPPPKPRASTRSSVNPSVHLTVTQSFKKPPPPPPPSTIAPFSSSQQQQQQKQACINLTPRKMSLSSSKLPSVLQKASSTPSVTPTPTTTTTAAAAGAVVVAPSTNTTSSLSFESHPPSLGEYFDKENETTDDSLSLLADEFSRSTTSSMNTDY